jgi:hypothetical protein
MTIEPFSQLKTLVLSNESILYVFIEQISKNVFNKNFDTEKLFRNRSNEHLRHLC